MRAVPLASNAAAPAVPARSAAIDWLRAGSILWIVGFWHLVDYVPGFGPKGELNVRITVVLLGTFVLVSGYLMGRQPVPLTRDGLRRFFFRRFGRIFPPFLAALGVFALARIGTLATLAKAALLVAMVSGPPPLTLWFITMICLFYLVTPLLLAARSDARRYVGWTALAALVLVAVCLASRRVDDRLGLYFPVYCAGVWLARPGVRLPRIGAPLLVLLALAAALSLAARGRVPFDGDLIALPLAMSGALVVFLGVMRLDDRLPAWPLVGAVSFASYFMYLFHRPIYMRMEAVTGGDPALLALGALPMVIVLSWVGQRAYDRLWTALTTARLPVQREPETLPAA